jgi:antitoxin component of MazEF toxin-antitoxin module
MEEAKTTSKERFKYPVIPVLQMILETKVKKQGNSNVIILPKKLGFKPEQEIKVMILNKKTATVGDIAGLFEKELKGVDTFKELKKNEKRNLERITCFYLIVLVLLRY